MDQNLKADDFSESRVNVDIPLRKTNDKGDESNKCNQCDYISSLKGNLKRHLKAHSGEKSNKCNQCDFASFQAGHLRTHLKAHSGEKSKKMQPM